MSDEIVLLVSYSNPFEAEWAKETLKAEGIPAFVSGEAVGGLFAGMGGAFGQVQLHVAESNAERALAILEAAAAEEDDGPGEERASSSAITRQRKDDEEEGETALTAADRRSRLETEPSQTAKAAIQAPSSQTTHDDDLDDDPRVSWGPDDYANRAWRAAVIGLVFGWGILHLYSIWQLLHLGSTPDDKPSEAGMRKVYGALALDCLVLGLLALAAVAIVDSISR
jgi:hypothetical protein